MSILVLETRFIYYETINFQKNSFGILFEKNCEIQGIYRREKMYSDVSTQNISAEGRRLYYHFNQKHDKNYIKRTIIGTLYIKSCAFLQNADPNYLRQI